MMKKIFLTFLLLISASFAANATPIISGISTNEINIDTKFRGAKILLFGAKDDAGEIVITVRGPKRNFMVTKKHKLLGVWYNGERLKFKDTYSLYSLFSTFNAQEPIDDLLKELELGRNNLNFSTSDEIDEVKKNEFQLQLVDRMEKNHLYNTSSNKIDFLNETLFKVILDFPKNISRGIYTVEIYLINEGSLVSFQSIPIYVNQVGFSAKVLDFAFQQSFLYALLSVAIALIFGWLANYLFARFLGK
jgi:uncharacterized protein (TIGR02186 family)